MAIIRSVLGTLILFFDWAFTPKSLVRDPELQRIMDQRTGTLSLYEYAACPFCVKVRRAMKRKSLVIRRLDIKRSQTSRNELLAGGGKLKVPCLKIEEEDGGVRWMYESSDIVDYLTSRFCTEPVESALNS
ncbi:MAG: glutathione S-transferase N-terminal domain-containing protein [Pseudomonadales bacterium]|nr:glutathione S-transferase N-terminal domain-containing protein [Pseudomonadales bacterium]